MENNRPMRPDIILCEGTDDQRFLFWLLKEKNFKGDDQTPYFQILTTKGKDKLIDKLKSLPGQDGFDSAENKVKSIAVIFDADNDAAKSAGKIMRAFEIAGFAAPKKPGLRFQDAKADYPDVATGFMLFPRLDDKPVSGMLESLCMDILAIDAMPCVRCCVDTAIRDMGTSFARPDKNRLHAMLSLTDKHVGQTIGQAAAAGSFRPQFRSPYPIEKFPF